MAVDAPSPVRPSLVTVGGLTVDCVIAADGAVALERAGGNGAYSAVGALLWADRVGVVSCAPRAYPGSVLARLQGAGVDTGGVRWFDYSPASCGWFVYDAEGRREEGLNAPAAALAEAGLPTDRLDTAQVAEWSAALRARAVPGEVSYAEFRAAHPITPAQVPEGWLSARGVHLAPSAPEVMTAMLDRFASGRPIITADPGWQLAERPLASLAPLLVRLDAFLPSEVEARALVPGAGPEQALRVLADLCPGAVAVKLGPRGVLVWDRAADRGVPVPPAPAATLDPTGAGDAFCGGFLAGLVETADPVAAARFGALSAARVVERFGAEGALPHDRAAARATLSRAA
ncbi:MAG: carbohydrate kinase family protein [Rubrimonas sp.]